MADGTLFRLAFVVVVVSAAALWVSSCAPVPPDRKMDWGAVADAYERSLKK